MYDYRERVNQVHCCVNNYVNCVDERVSVTTSLELIPERVAQLFR